MIESRRGVAWVAVGGVLMVALLVDVFSPLPSPLGGANVSRAGHGDAASQRPRRLLGTRGSAVLQHPTVTLIGDSVADEIAYLTSARAVLSEGVRLQLAVAPCRRLVAESCSVAGFRPSTVLQLVEAQRGSLGQVVILAVGYNDYASTFARDLDEVLRALHAANVQETILVTLRATRHPYLTMNDVLRAAAAESSRIALADWNRYSRSHPSWFKEDGLHLTPAGAAALASLLHRELLRIGVSRSTHWPSVRN